jgi:hypothetical protein
MSVYKKLFCDELKTVADENGKLYVNSNATNTVGSRGYYNAPYLNITDAVAAATDGDTIILQTDMTETVAVPDLNLNFVVPPGITWTADTGALITNTGVSVKEINIHVFGALTQTSTGGVTFIACSNGIVLYTTLNLYGHGSGILTITDSGFVDVTTIDGFKKIDSTGTTADFINYSALAPTYTISNIGLINSSNNLFIEHAGNDGTTDINMFNIDLINWTGDDRLIEGTNAGTNNFKVDINNVKVNHTDGNGASGGLETACLIAISKDSTVRNCEFKTASTKQLIYCLENTGNYYITACTLITTGAYVISGVAGANIFVTNCNLNCSTAIPVYSSMVTVEINSANSISTNFDITV